MATFLPTNNSQSALSIDDIPEHLGVYIVKQQPELYTAIDHAVWHFIMAIAQDALSKSAHPQYVDGLKKTGISTDKIPLISTMDEHLRQFGWRAVAVSGFIPPAIFMEFQALRILPIACDMRKLENLGYTPAPDIVHEAAGHAPMIANSDYSDYLQHYGEVARKAIYSKSDLDIYLAIRTLSETKEDPNILTERIEKAEEQLMQAIANSSYTSEGAQLARFYWWTVEYGLVGSLENPLIYGAGLLSSVSEAETCLKPDVLKIPFTLDSINNSYDITRPQPQLYVASDFKSLSIALETFAKTMAYNTGGIEGLSKAQIAQSVCTLVFETELQVSGVLNRFILSEDNQPSYLQLNGPCQLSFNDIELEGHGPNAHKEGYGCALGKVKGVNKPLSQFTQSDWKQCGFSLDIDNNEKGQLVFDSGIRLEGELVKLTQHPVHPEITLIAQFKNCTVKNKEISLFEPEWGVYDLACAESIISVFGGPADRVSYMKKTDQIHPPIRAQKNNLTSENTELVSLYQSLQELKDKLKSQSTETIQNAQTVIEILTGLLHQVSNQFPEDWLLSWQLLELCKLYQLEPNWLSPVKDRLFTLASNNQHPQAPFIMRGLKHLYSI